MNITNKIAVGALLIPLALIVFFAIDIIHTRAQVKAVRDKFFKSDHEAILNACRQMHERREDFRKQWHYVDYAYLHPEDVIWDKKAGSMWTNVPEVVQELDPLVIILEPEKVMLRLPVPGARAYVFAFPKGSFEYGTEKVIPGLWYWNGHLHESVRAEFDRRMEEKLNKAKANQGVHGSLESSVP